MKKVVLSLTRALLAKRNDEGDHVPAWSKIVIVFATASLATLAVVDPSALEIVVNIFK